LLAFAGEIPENDKDAGDETVNDQVEREAALTGLVGQCVHQLSDAQAKDEMESRTAHREHRIDQGKRRDGNKPIRAGFHNPLSAQFLFDKAGE
jgi:hypothetical protein